MHPLAQLDHAHVWHPFTQMRDYLRREPIVLVRGRKATLEDAYGRRYLDANSSIWTNLHGHQHPKIDRALRGQLKKLAHASALGLANEPASLLAKELVKMAQPLTGSVPNSARPITKVFYSDNGSTAMEVALKLSYEYSRRTLGPTHRPRFLTVKGGYHGDTIGAVSLGSIPLFHQAYRGLLFPTENVMAPYCYRCPHNRAKPERTDARTYRRCRWECVDQFENRLSRAKKSGRPISAFVFEPGIQGSAGMIPQPQGWLSRVAEIARGHGVQLVADEVLTGFGRTGGDPGGGFPLLAGHREGVLPDFIAVAKGLTGGYLPLAATLTTQSVFDAFLGEYSEFKTFFHGHSYTANPLGCSAALASMRLLNGEHGPEVRAKLEAELRELLAELWHLPQVGDIRQVGLIAGIELVKNPRDRTPFELSEQAGLRVTAAMTNRRVLTRPIGNVIVIMPPYCTTRKELRQMVTALAEAIAEVFPRANHRGQER